MITKLKDRVTYFLEIKLKTGEVYRIATFLCSQFRQFCMLPQSEQKAVHNIRERLALTGGNGNVREGCAAPAKSRYFKSGMM